ncbi:hypothetical protein [Candidatus Poriferisodalis sp.]|uniref:hypothetical protein n=1 Tax=Candidatus Poriferisodalis sp. TaxID=3101277 RepID=UPI003B026DC9
MTKPDQCPIAERVVPHGGWLLVGNVIAFAFVGLSVRTIGPDWSSGARALAFVALSLACSALWLAWQRSVRRAAARAGEASPV